MGLMWVSRGWARQLHSFDKITPEFRFFFHYWKSEYGERGGYRSEYLNTSKSCFLSERSFCIACFIPFRFGQTRSPVILLTVPVTVFFGKSVSTLQIST